MSYLFTYTLASYGGKVKLEVMAVLKLVKLSYLEVFWTELLASYDVDGLEIELDAQSFSQQHDHPTRRAGG